MTITIMSGWTPLFQQIVTSSIWEAPDHVRVVWITMLAIARKDGIVPVTPQRLAKVGNVTLDHAHDAIKVLSSPDADTLSQDDEGRRIERVDGGWKILNWDKFRNMARSAATQEANREAQARWRQNNQPKPSPEPEEEQEPVNNQVDRVYEQYPKKASKPKALIAIRNAISKFGFEFVFQKTIEYAKARQGQNPQYTPFPQGWFNANRFNDDPSTWKDTGSTQPTNLGQSPDPADPKDIRNFL